MSCILARAPAAQLGTKRFKNVLASNTRTARFSSSFFQALGPEGNGLPPQKSPRQADLHRTSSSGQFCIVYQVAGWSASYTKQRAGLLYILIQSQKVPASERFGVLRMLTRQRTLSDAPLPDPDGTGSLVCIVNGDRGMGLKYSHC